MARLRTYSLVCETVCEPLRQTCADYHTRPLPLFILQPQKGPMETQRMRDIFQNAHIVSYAALPDYAAIYAVVTESPAGRGAGPILVRLLGRERL